MLGFGASSASRVLAGSGQRDASVLLLSKIDGDDFSVSEIICVWLVFPEILLTPQQNSSP